jgi:hypothetical protein
LILLEGSQPKYLNVVVGVEIGGRGLWGGV